MERRTAFLIAGLLVAFASLGGAFCVWAFGPDELEVKLEQVQVGMDEREVEVALGRKPNFAGSLRSKSQGWHNDRVTVRVHNDVYGKVLGTEVERTPLWDRIRAKLPW